MIRRWRERLDSALPPASEQAGPASVENRAPLGRTRVTLFAAGVLWIGVAGFLAFSPDSPLHGFGPSDAAAVTQTPTDLQRVESYVPVPEPANVPPLTVAELARTGGDAWISANVPTPEPANLPPPSITDLAGKDRDAAIAERVPMPEPAGVPPITRKDIKSLAATDPAAAPPAATPPSPAVDPSKLTGKALIDAPLSPSIAPTDVAVAERLRDLLATRLERFISRKNERAAVEAFYRDRGFVPLWVERGGETARATAAIAYLKGVAADGLDPADYPTPNFKSIADADGIADAELKLTASVLDYARHAQTGRVHFSRVSADIFYVQEVPEPAEILAKLADAKDTAAALDSYNPPHEGYKALKAKLAEARGQTDEPAPVRIDAGPLLKVGVKDARVPQLRERLGVAGDGEVYDKALAEAVKKFQVQHKLSATGNLNAATIAALNGGPKRGNVADIIIANMERWRWLPRDLGKSYSMLNIPDFTLKVVKNGAVAWRTKVVVGKPGSMATPILSETMKFITVNPTWNVPPSIVANEYLPALAQDSTVMERMGIKVAENPDGTVRMFMPPGDRNALGRLRFNFPNKFLVYQHDTADKHLFKQERRAFSHGCMRVEDPVRYAEVMLSIALPKEGYTEEKIRRMFGPAEVDIRFPNPVPVHITYQTAFVDDAGKLQLREDLYGRDAALLGILKGSERRVADVAIERHRVAVPRDELRLPGTYNTRARGGSFFSWFLAR